MRIITFTYLFLLPVLTWAQQILPTQDKAQILNIMKNQQNCWNKGDLDCFMEGYWKSDSLKFIGKKGLNYGWQTTLDNYKKSYPDKASMGQLKFTIITTEALGNNHGLVIGKWQLKRIKGDIGGHFSLTWAKKDGEWVIVVDHSS